MIEVPFKSFAIALLTAYYAFVLEDILRVSKNKGLHNLPPLPLSLFIVFLTLV
jgi:hypothetical protein